MTDGPRAWGKHGIMARHLLDSDVLIFALRGRPGTVAFVQDLLREEVPAISALSYFEVWTGVRPHEEESVRAFLSSLDVVPVTGEIAHQAGEYSRAFRKRGITLGVMDNLIAATAKVHHLSLVTGNIRDFPMTDIQTVAM